jgi:sialic acid synthase SpsE
MTRIKDIMVGRHTIGMDHPTYFIADIAANHDGSLQRAIDLIHLCAEAGAHAAKFQNFKAETIVSDYGFKILGAKQSHQANWKKDVSEVYADASLPMEWTTALHKACDEAGIDYFTSPYDLDLIAALSPHVCAWKVGSGDITWLENIEAMARDGKPLFLATGAATMDDVRRAVATAHQHTGDIVLMQCNTNYTGSLENFRHIALNVLKTYAREYPHLLLGLSDHTPGHATVLGAVTLGARAIEKHFTDDTSREGPDHAFAMDARAWREMVDRTQELQLALGAEEKRIMDNEVETAVLQRRALHSTRTLRKGERVTTADVIALRPCPADALPPYRLADIIGRVLTRDIRAGEFFRASDVG